MHERIDCPISQVSIFRLKFYKDDRGSLSELWRRDEHLFGMNCMEPTMCYLSSTEPGVARGPHEHEAQWDRFAFFDGKFYLSLWENREKKPPWSNYRQRFTFVVGKDWPTLVEVPPGVVHGYKNIGDEPALVLNLPNRLYAGWRKQESVDEIRWEDDPDSPFEIP